MAIYGRKEKKLRRSISKKQEYNKLFGGRIAKGDRETPSYAEWLKASATKKAWMKAGQSRAKWSRSK